MADNDNKRVKVASGRSTLQPEDALKEFTTISRKDLVADKNANAKSNSGLSGKRNGLGNLDRLKSVMEGNQQQISDADGQMDLLPDLYMVYEILVSSILSPRDYSKSTLSIVMDRNVPPTMAEAVRLHFTTDFNFESRMQQIVGDAIFYYGSHTLIPMPVTAISNFIAQNSTLLASSGGNMDNLMMTDMGWLAKSKNSSKTHSQVKNGGYTLECANRFIANVRANLNPYDCVFEYSPEVVPTSKEAIDIALEAANTKFAKTVADEMASKLTGKLSISDNGFALLKPDLRRYIRNRDNSSALTGIYGMEAAAPKKRSKTTTKMDDTIDPYLTRVFENMSSARFEAPTDDMIEKNKLNPLVLSVHHGAIIPVCVPGEPENHVGYFVAVDDDGNILKRKTNQNYFKDLNDRLKQAAGSNEFQVVNTLSSGVLYNSGSQIVDHSKAMLDIYISTIEEDLKEAVKEGRHGEEVEISKPLEIYRIMLSRQLSNMGTTLVYLPAEMVSYFAFDYTPEGVGLSLLEKTKLYASLRAVLMFANIMAGVKNSVGRRKLSIKLDDDDPEKSVTVETIINEFVALQTSTLPIGRLNPADIVDSLQRAGIQVVVDGGSYWPETSLDLEETHRDIHKPDTDLEDLLRRLHYASFSVTPEQVDRSMEGDFATGITTANILQAKRIQMWQTAFVVQASEFVKMYIRQGGPLYQELKEEYEKWPKKGSMTFAEAIDSIAVELPKPDTAVVKAQWDELKDYKDFIEEVIDIEFDTDHLADMLGGEELRESLVPAINQLKSNLIREFRRRNNILPELDAMIYHTDNSPVPAISEHNRKTLELIGALLSQTRKDEVKIEKKLRKVLDAIANEVDPVPVDDSDLTPADDDYSSYEDPDINTVDDEQVLDDSDSELPEDDSSLGDSSEEEIL